MNGEVTARGGARIGWANATWPFARLKAERSGLSLKVFLFGSYQFSPENVVSLEKYGLIPFLGQGIKITHSVHEYPTKIVFWCLGRPNRLISRIKETGFTESGRMPVESTRSGFPVRWQAVLLMVVLWNVLFLIDDYYGGKGGGSGDIGSDALLALLLFTAIPIGIKYYRPLQKIFLKEGRSPKEIGVWLNFMPTLSGIMFVFFLIHYLSGGG